MPHLMLHAFVLYTQSEVTSHSLWSRHDRHFVVITRHNVWSEGGDDLLCYPNKIESVGLRKRSHNR